MPGKTKQLLWLLAFCLGTGLANARSYPAKPVKIIAPFTAGGLGDWLIRDAA